MWEERARRARQEILALANGGLGVSDLHAAALRLIEATVPTELTCWAAIDPETLVISTMTSGDTRIPAGYEPRLAEAEYAGDEPHTFAQLAVRHQPTARLSELSEHERTRSRRLNSVWRPLGLDRELRVMFTVDQTCWGAAGLVRAGTDFTDRETAFLVEVAPAVASATRVAVRSEASTLHGGLPAIAVVGPRGGVRAATGSAREWQSTLDDIAPGRFNTMMRVMASGARSAASGVFRARIRDAYGRWASLEASRLIGADANAEDEVAVNIQPSLGDQVSSLLMTAYGLSTRERDVCREVMAGHSTTDIGHRLFISAHTVQDHLKSIFTKVGVQSRGELVARLRPGP